MKSEIGSWTRRERRDQRKLPTNPLTGVNVNKQGSLHTSLVLVTRPQDGSISAHTLPNLKSVSRGLNWVQMVSTIPYSFKVASLKLAPTVGTMGRGYIRKTR